MYSNTCAGQQTACYLCYPPRQTVMPSDGTPPYCDECRRKIREANGAPASVKKVGG